MPFRPAANSTHRRTARPAPSPRSARLARAVILVAGTWIAASTATARAEDHPVFLQWFETRWSTVEYRIPDFFLAGYDSTWLPPPFKAADPTSAGFDTFDRFDLGTPGAETAYGTREFMRAMIDEFHQSSSLVYIDLVMNHDSGRNNSDDFYNAGGYPGLALRVGSDFWGDFHDGSTQSHQPNPQPGDAPYNLFDGDLVGLIDIAHEKNYSFIRQPVTAGNPLNIPAGTIRNKPDAGNAQYYPDTALAPSIFVNSRLPAGQQTVTIYPYNTASPLAGDPIPENATGYLARSTQWMLDVMHVDGFRLDAAKHIPSWFWDQYYDSAVFNRRRTFAGNFTTPFSFGEVVESNSFTQGYTRKDGFGNRDALDLNGAGQLRDILNNRGLGSWDNVLFSHLDTADGGGDTLNSFGNNGSLGVTHVFSHDNGSAGNGGSAPPLPGAAQYALPEFCYLLFRPGPPIIYHNSREFIDRFQFRGFWPREGSPTALGLFNADLTTLVRLSNGYARGEFRILNYTDNVNSSRADTLIFERRRDNGSGNLSATVLVGVNDSYLSGVAVRNVQTSFAPGTRLHELTGNHADPVVDAANEIPELLVVDGDRRVTIPIPYNKSSTGVEHHKGYVVYGPAAPSGTLEPLTISGQPFASLLPADTASVPAYRRRLAPIPVITTAQFELRLTTAKTDPSDPDWDNAAAFRIDGGYPSAGAAPDFNGQNNGPDYSDADPIIPRFESFVTQSSPLADAPGASNGLYRQTIDCASLSEGYHYIKAVAFRRRPSGTDPIFTEFRRVIYVDRSPPAAALLNSAVPINSPAHTFRVQASDRTTTAVYILINVPAGADPLTLLTPANLATQYDRFEWRRSVTGLPQGANSVTVVALEITGNAGVTTYPVNVTVGSGDVTMDGKVTIDDLYAAFSRLINGPAFNPGLNPSDSALDVNASGTFDINDLRTLESILRPTEAGNMAQPQR